MSISSICLGCLQPGPCWFNVSDIHFQTVPDIVLCVFLQVRCGLSVRSVYLNYENDLAAQLDAAYEKDSFAALVVTNPNNPTGEVIAPNALKSYFEWCCRKGVHLIR